VEDTPKILGKMSSATLDESLTVTHNVITGREWSQDHGRRNGETVQRVQGR